MMKLDALTITVAADAVVETGRLVVLAGAVERRAMMTE